jgi:hypothetical protein
VISVDFDNDIVDDVGDGTKIMCLGVSVLIDEYGYRSSDERAT